MKKLIIAILLISGFQKADAQEDSLPVYRRFPTLPAFTITTVPDSIKFTKADLKKRKVTLIMLFNPDCSHCQDATKDLIEHMDLFKKARIIMVTSLDFSSIKKFYDDYKIAGYPNITMGRDGTYFLGTFYKIHNYPSIFLYNKKGKFVEAFEGSVKMEKIAASL
jgi:thioredoxin-related protein